MPSAQLALAPGHRCKFCYYPEDFGPLGCGRCVVSCPVAIDITEVMRDVAEAR
jgi:predicted aldo/keto reductase-like oxidoreductase